MTGAQLLSVGLRTAWRAPVSKNGSPFLLSAGGEVRDRWPAVSQKTDNMNLTRCEIFRGKVPPRTTQN
jgi:hypothetical protein